MSTNDVDEVRALESLRFDGEPDRRAVSETKSTLMALHATQAGRSRIVSRVGIAAAFLVALGVGAKAGPRVVEWWEHVFVAVDEPLPDGRHHVVVEDDEGNTLLDDTLEADEAILQIEPGPDDEGSTLLRVVPSPAPDETKPAPH